MQPRVQSTGFSAAREEPRRRTHLGALVVPGQRFRFGYNYAYHLNAPISPDGRNWIGRHRPAEPLGGDVSARVRTPQFGDGWIRRRAKAGTRRVPRRISTACRTRRARVRGPHHPVWCAGAVPQVRAPHRHLAARQLHVQRPLHRQLRRGLPARLLFDVRWSVRRSGATYHSPTIAPFIDDNWQIDRAATLQLGLRWEYLAPWAEQNGVEAPSMPRRQDRVQRAADDDARRSWCRWSSVRTDIFRTGSCRRI